MPDEASFGRTWRIVVAFGLPLFTVTYNLYAMTVAIPAVVKEFAASVGEVQTILILSSLLTAAFIPTSFNLGRIYGRKRLFVMGLILYAGGILVTAASSSIGTLILGYAIITGVAASPLVTAPWDVVSKRYQGRHREIAVSVLAAAATTGNLAGSVVGGFLVTAYGWRWAFVLQLGIVVIALWLVRLVPETAKEEDVFVDWIGGLLAVLGLGMLLLGVTLSGEYGWWTPRKPLDVAGLPPTPLGVSIVPFLVAIGVVFQGVYAFWHRRQTERGKAPVLRMGLLRSRLFLLGLATSGLYALVISGVMYDLYIFVPTALSLDSFDTAIALLPFTLSSVIVTLGVLYFGERFPKKYIVQGGLVLIGIGIWLLHGAISPTVTEDQLIPGLLSMGVGNGLVGGVIGLLVLSVAGSVPSGESQGVYSTVQDLATSLGTATLGALLITTASISITDGVLEEAAIIVDQAERQQLIFDIQQAVQTLTPKEQEAIVAEWPENVQQALDELALTAVIDGMHNALLASLAVVVLCLLVSAFLPRRADSG